MLSKRIIPCLDIKNGETVKGVNFVDLRSAGDPIELASRYVDEGADELVFLDITATVEGRPTIAGLVKEISSKINIPFTVGGGITCEDDVSILLDSGADKITINSAAVKNPDLLDKFASRFGSQCVVLAIDTKFNGNDWEVYVKGGREATGLDTLTWAKEVVERGAGEILLTSMNNDGTKKGFAIDITRELSENLSVPIVASGGAGKMDHFDEVFKDGLADAALAASIFHFGEIAIPDLKKYLINKDIPIRL